MLETSPTATPVAPTRANTDNMVTFDFRKEKEKYDTLIGSWREEREKVRKRREIRENKKNVEDERKKGTILEDETIIPDRTVNTNIRQGRGPYINYITQSERLLLVTEVNKTGRSLLSLENWFTDGMRYPKWKTPWFRVIDGMHTHGGCALEVMYDKEKPFHCTVDYVSRENLIFPKKCKNIQAAPRLLRCYEISTLELEEYTLKYNFIKEQVDKILDTYKDKDDFIKIYRVLFKKDGIVYNAWYSDECQDWLRAPVVHDIGLFDFDPAMLLTPTPSGEPFFLSVEFAMAKEQLAKPLPLREYPIIWFPYEITENETLLETQGRVALDLHVQEALTETMTATVNSCTRASRLYATAAAEPGGDPEVRELGKLKHGSILSHGLSLMQFPWPNNIILAVKQALELSNAQDAGQMDNAAMARKDANKTAHEMQLAEQKHDEIVTSDMDVFSNPVLDTLTLCFNVACHQAIFSLVPQPPEPQLLLGNYNTRPAGDVEVVKRMKDEQNAKELFNILQGTPIGMKLLEFIIRRYFPDEADAWMGSLQGPDKDAIIMQLVEILQQIPTDELTPDQLSALRNLIAVASSVVKQPGDMPANQAPASPQGGTPSPSNDNPQNPTQQ